MSKDCEIVICQVCFIFADIVTFLSHLKNAGFIWFHIWKNRVNCNCCSPSLLICHDLSKKSRILVKFVFRNGNLLRWRRFYKSFRFVSKIIPYCRSNGYIPSYFSSFSQPNLFGKFGVGAGTQQPTMNHKTNQVSAHMSGHGHRRLPPTPNKPSTLFTQTASMAFHNFSHQFTKPSSLTFR